jgi:hypothetical protein
LVKVFFFAENMETVRMILYKGITALLIVVIMAGISAPTDGNPECPGPPGDSSAGQSSLDLPDGDMDDTVMPPGRMIHPVLFFVQFLHLPRFDFPQSAPVDPVYKPPKSA